MEFFCCGEAFGFHGNGRTHDEIITDEQIRMVVDKMDKNRIEKVHIYLPEDFYDEDEEKED